ncbi:gliding motility lipoprotein GldB [Fulvivirga sedimenti]|uniref:Gliding motility lipoprotein GldB n=1 Tax=Fulvivirga sedimenti TaxID=2879465 RepID=A0A9X1HWC4_9BACT|nr:gliding motility lipoprotein GldB [Fulvivirga sedimenti]MCA6078595.1 gliding motility lipoprotein GldB [Fulvivirga sedimenti]
MELQDELLGISDRDEMINFLNDNPVVAEVFLKRSEYPTDSIMIDVMLDRFTNPYIDTLGMEVAAVFGDLTDLKMELNDAYSHVQYYYPDFKIPEIKTVISGIEYDLFMSDSLVIIGLDYFLGEGARFRPAGMYQYMLARYTPEKITPSLMLLYGISPRWNRTELNNKSMLADMITYGKAYYFAKHMMPCTPDSVIISYTAENMTGVRQNAGTIWAHFLENELLFETSHMVKKKYLDERPNTYEIGDKAPGRIATWVGWEIVKSYMRENPDISLQELMAEPDAQKILDRSNYAPKNQ